MPGNARLFFERANHLGAQIIVHEASDDDINRDRNVKRRDITKSKLSKYPRIPRGIISRERLIAIFGPIKNENDAVDCALLNSVYSNSVDILVTEDSGIHKRANLANIADRVLNLREINKFLSGSVVEKSTQYLIRNVTCDQLDAGDEIFSSLSEDYTGFFDWLTNCQKKRRGAWAIFDEKKIAALIIYKDEDKLELSNGTTLPSVRKLCTFKVDESYRGDRLGELLLRQALFDLFEGDYQGLYLTAYNRQIGLIEMISDFGFNPVDQSTSGELIFYRNRDWVTAGNKYISSCVNYPNIWQPNSGVIVPIKYHYHQRLFPEGSRPAYGQHFDLFLQQSYSPSSAHLTAVGSAIKKAYVCNAQLQDIMPGTAIFFYLGKTEEGEFSQCITSIGICEEYITVRNLDQLFLITAKRTVYNQRDLTSIYEGSSNPTRVLRFVACGYLKTPISLDELVNLNVLAGPPQSLMRIDASAVSEILRSRGIASRPV